LISEVYKFQVPFFDVDSMEIAWHGHYCKYLELARCKLLDKIGYNYKAMARSGYAFPIIDMRLKYVKPLVFEQDVEIVATLKEWQYQLKIDYLISDANSGERMTKAYTKQAAVDLETGSMRLECPYEFVQCVNRLLSE
jgi:acyl-CoA thioester hydrolase